MAREVTEKLYRVSFYGCGNRRFVECSSLEDLYDYVARRVAQGNICMSVSEVCLDGSLPKVSVLSTKEYKEILRRYLKQKSAEK